MSLTLQSSVAQQNFGQLIDRALTEDDVIIERYGRPRVAIVNYQRYQHLLDAERELLRLRLQQASAAASARTEHLTDAELDALIEDAREEVAQQVNSA
ncbi:MAG: type II toxin-antitoxin system Phd/YefM family antitoxin [Caldilineaceae bacterium]|nr:type II toxin-antitoxin system Phd/YefM family antitoxin [Caldilineaceae bacterium]